MPIRVRVEGHGIVEFPDGTSQAEMEAALKQLPSLQAAPQPEGKSVSGFLGNVVSSGANFAKDTIMGIPQLAKLVATNIPQYLAPTPAGALSQGQGALETLKALGQMVSDRYGSLEKVGNTLYTDPVGVAADVSTLTGIGGAAAGARAPGLAGRLRMIERATNPVAAVTAPLAKATDLASDVVIGGTLRPPAAVRSEFGGTRGVAKAVKQERVYSQASSEKKLNRSRASADALLAEKEAAGVPGVNTSQATSALLGKPAEKAVRRERLGETGQSDALLDRAVKIEGANPQQIPLTEAQALKREAQELAYESGADNLSVKKSGEQALAQALREGIEQQAPEVGPINQQSQRLLGAKRAFEAAEDRPRALTNTLATLGGGGAMLASGDPSALLLGAVVKAMDSPRAGALTGIGLNEFGRGMNANSMRQAALVARLLSEGQQ